MADCVNACPPYFVLTVDTEEEWDWKAGFPTAPFSVRNVERLPDFQVFCDDLGIRPTYFVDHAVASDPACIDLIRRLEAGGNCDVGSHLHPWCTPPYAEPIDDRSSRAMNLSTELFANKLDTLTERLRDVLGRHPYSYRSGRWGITPGHLRTLSAAGYRIDSSSWPYSGDALELDGNHGLDPYFPALGQEEPSGAQQQILEVPVSGGFQHPAFERLERLHGAISRPPLDRLRLVGALWHAGLMRKTALTPEGHHVADLKRLIDALDKRGTRVFHMFMHSSDLLPGFTPYVRNERELSELLARLRDAAVHAMRVHGARPVTLRELRSALTGST